MTTDADSLPPRGQAALRWAAGLLTLAAIAALAWNCLLEPSYLFLGPGPGRWILYPMPPELEAYNGIPVIGTFQRSFVLPEKPAAATLDWRLLKEGRIIVNHNIITPPDTSFLDWKTTARADIAPWLHAGANEIVVEAENALGPPALSLALRAGDFSLESDESWQVSLSGSTERAAQFAADVPRPQKGNVLYGLETTGQGFARSWPALLLLGALSLACAALQRRWRILLTVLGVAWLALFLHNIPVLPYAAGFDASHHLEYIAYLQNFHRLPHASEGWEMFQPPLYYIISAGLLDLIRTGVSHAAGILALRYLSLVIGAANLALVYLGLRLLFPGDRRKPLAGLVLAAFLPAEICLLHYPTNETLSALFVTGALCVCLQLLTAAKPWRGWPAALGIVLGLALSSKASALLAIPVILGVLALQLLLRREPNPLRWLEMLLVPLVLCALIGGWHYGRLYHDFGDPFTGNWNPKIAAPWWQYKGLQTPHYFLTFGRSLARPFYAGIYSFWDGLYSTLWGDGLLGGKVNIWTRPPWNYNLMAAGYVLALVPMGILLTGLARASREMFRAARPCWILLLGFAWLFAFAAVAMSLKIPSYAQAKAFYALPLLLPFCAVAALGFDYWMQRGRLVSYAMVASCVLWITTVYASFWIRPNTVQSQLSSAIAVSFYLNADTSQTLLDILKENPQNADATIWLASAPEFKKNPKLAAAQLAEAFKAHPENASIEAFFAWYLVENNQISGALLHAKHAAESAPDDKMVCQIWMNVGVRARDKAETIAAARQVLNVDPTDVQAASCLRHLDAGR